MLRELWLSHLQTLGRLNSLRCGPTSKVLKEQVFLSSGLFEGALATTESLDFCSLAAALHPSVAGCTLQMLSEKQGPCQRLAALKTAAGNVFHCYLFSQWNGGDQPGRSGPGHVPSVPASSCHLWIFWGKSKVRLLTSNLLILKMLTQLANQAAVGACDRFLSPWDNYPPPVTGRVQPPTVKGMFSLISVYHNVLWESVTKLETFFKTTS